MAGRRLAGGWPAAGWICDYTTKLSPAYAGAGAELGKSCLKGKVENSFSGPGGVVGPRAWTERRPAGLEGLQERGPAVLQA